jgi:hypothetical protein
MNPNPLRACGAFTRFAVLVLAPVLFCTINLHANTLLYWNGSAPGGPASGTWSMNTNNLTWSTNNFERIANDSNPQAYLGGSKNPIPIFANGNGTDGLPGPYTVTVDNSYGQVYITDMHCDVGPLTLTGGVLCWYGDINAGPGYNLISALSTNVFIINCPLSNSWTSGDGTAFHKYKTGTLILGTTNLWNGEGVMIEGGTLMISVDQSFPAGTSLILGNGDGRGTDGFVDTPPTFNSAGHNQTLGTLTLTGPDDTIPRTIDFSNHQGSLSFANSSGVAWTTSNNASNSANPGPINLTVTNYSTATAKLRFGTDNTGLTSTQLGQIQFADYLNLPGVIDTNGFVTPALPVMQSVVVSGTSVQITWSIVPNWTYQLQYRTDFSSPWQTLGNYSSNGNSITAMDTLSPPARYYRVQVLPL